MYFSNVKKSTPYNPHTIKLTKEAVVEYFKEHSLPECAKHFGCSPTTIKRRLRSWGVDTSIHNEILCDNNVMKSGTTFDKSLGVVVDAPRLDKATLRSKYIEQSKSLYETAKELGTTSATVRYWLKKYGITVRTKKEQEILNCGNPEWQRAASERSKQLWSDPVRLKIAKEQSDAMWEDQELRAKDSEFSKKLWQDEERRKCAGAIAKTSWANVEYREKQLRSWTDERRLLNALRMSKIAIESWKNPEYRAKQIAIKNNPEFKEKMLANLFRHFELNKSEIEKTLCSILDDLKIRYESSYAIGPFSFDCFLTDYNILIECQGDYWHSTVEAVRRDKAKSTYITEYYPQYKLKYVWEHEFGCKTKVVDLIKYWCDITSDEIIDFDFDAVAINDIDYKTARLFIEKYHYSGTLGNQQVRYGAFVNGELAAVCIFGTVTRNETAVKLRCIPSEVRELTRFCIHPKYQKRNFASWLISRATKLLHEQIPNIKCLVTFADSTFGHEGTIYKAVNWEYDGLVEPSYWYRGDGGWIMHKKTLYNHATKNNMTESEFALKYGYTKIIGKEKHRYIKRF